MRRPIARVVFAAVLAAAVAGGRTVKSQAQEPPPYEVRYLLGLGGNHSRGNSINNQGWIAGYSHLDASYRHATLWQGDLPTDLGALGSKNKPKNSNVVWPVKNTRGLIVGISGECDDAIGSATARHAVLWDEGTVTELPSLGGDEWNTPTAINERGDVAGFSDHPGDVITEAFIWTPEGGLQGLGFLYADHVLSEAFGMNESRQVVGISCNESECRAFLWQDGVMRDLNLLIAPDDSILLTHAMDINDDGVITGRAFRTANSERVTYVAAPTGSAIALGPATAAGTGRRRAQVLPASAVREILHPLGPGLDRLSAHIP